MKASLQVKLKENIDIKNEVEGSILENNNKGTKYLNKEEKAMKGEIEFLKAVQKIGQKAEQLKLRQENHN